MSMFPKPPCPQCRYNDNVIAEQQERIAALERQNEFLGTINRAYLTTIATLDGGTISFTDEEDAPPYCRCCDPSTVRTNYYSDCYCIEGCPNV